MRLLIFVLATSLFASCGENETPLTEQEKFTRIYDNTKFNIAFQPIDVRQTPDGGYLILASRTLTESNFSGIYLMKVDAFGSFVSELEVDPTFVNPIGPLMEQNGTYFFFCMTAIGLQAQLMPVTPAGTLETPIAVNGVAYPAAAAADGNGFILLSYDNVNKESVVSVLNAGGTVTRSQGFSIGAGDAVEEPIINHFLRTGRIFPFQVGRIPGGSYYFNGFYNYTFSLVFTNLSGPDPQGVLQGQQDDGGINSITLLTGNRFALSRFNFGANFFLPGQNIATSGIASSSDLGGYPLPELVAQAPVKILRTFSGTTERVIYGSHTRSRQILLYSYDPAGAAFLRSKYLGFANPFEFANFTETREGGLAVVGTTYVAGRFPRICLFKIPSGEFTELIR